MASDAALPAEPPPPPSEEDYQTFCAALGASARGRAFLAEYARRHRGADTETLLAALARLEALVRSQPRTGAQELRGELRGLIGAIRAAKPELAEAALPARAAKLALLVELLERRLAAMVEPAEGAVEAAQMAPLTVVPVPEQPELPIPSPAAAQPALALAHERAPGPIPVAAKPADSAAAIPEVSWFDDAPAAAVAAELASVPPAVDARTKPEIADAPSRGIAGSPPHPGRADARAGSCGEGSGVVVGVQGTPLPFRASPLPSPPPQGGREQAEVAALPEPTPAQQAPTEAPAPTENLRPRPAAKLAPPPDPLAALLALSEEERIALFT